MREFYDAVAMNNPVKGTMITIKFKPIGRYKIQIKCKNHIDV